MCTTQAYAVHTTLLLRWSKIPGFVNYEYPISQYNDAALRDIMLHLTTTFVGIHALDVLTLQNFIQQHHTEYMCIFQHIDKRWDAHVFCVVLLYDILQRQHIKRVNSYKSGG